ncbi:hypothetical protein [Xanthobacter sediminis]
MTGHAWRGYATATPLRRVRPQGRGRPAGTASTGHAILPKFALNLALPRNIRALVLAGAALLSTAALADTRIFIIDSSDGYGVDGCLASGAPCGEPVATAWCHSHDYARALDFGRVENEPLVPASSGTPRAECTGPLCEGAVAITCSR